MIIKSVNQYHPESWRFFHRQTNTMALKNYSQHGLKLEYTNSTANLKGYNAEWVLIVLLHNHKKNFQRHSNDEKLHLNHLF